MREAWYKKHRQRINLWFILVLSTVVRLFEIGKRDFWYDEAYTGNLIRHGWTTMMTKIINDTHPPLHYALLKIWSAIVGDTVVSLRLLSVIFGVLSVWLIYKCAQELFEDKRISWWSAAVAAVNPFLIQYAQETRMYALLGCLVLLAFFFLLRALKTQKRGWFIAHGIACALALLTHYMALPWLVCFLMVFIVWSWKKKIWPLKNAFLGLASGLIVFLPWLPYAHAQFTNVEKIIRGMLPMHVSDLLLNVVIFFIGTPKGELAMGLFIPNTVRGIPYAVLVWMIPLLLLACLIWLFRQYPFQTLMLGIMSIGFFVCIYGLSKLGQEYYLSRYLLPAASFLCLIVGATLGSLRMPYRLSLAGLYLVLLLLIQPLQNSQGFNEFYKHLDEYQGYHFYSFNTFDYILEKYYMTPERLILYNYNWPQYDSRPWPGMGDETKRTENFDEVKNDPKGLVILNVFFPIAQRDDKGFTGEGFERIATYQNVEIYRPLSNPSP